MKTRLLTSAAILFLVTGAHAEQIVINALPVSKVTSGSEKTSRELLDESKRSEARLLITRKGKKYVWASRENRPLVHVMSGAFHIFIDHEGSGYVKILDSSFIPDLQRQPGPRFSYMEHFHLHLGTITYWGTAESFAP